MFSVVSFGRMAILLTVCVLISACTQSSTSTFNGRLGPETASLTKAQKSKILAARKRAALKKARDAKKAKAARISAARKKRSHKTALLKKTRPAKTTRKKSVRKKKSAKLRRRGRAEVSKSRRVKVEKKSSAFVGGRTRGIAWNAPSRCVPARLKKVLRQVSRKFGRVIVNSTVRGARRNRLVGGKRRSYHLGCRAVDFRVRGRTRGLTRWLARHPSVGGFKRYRSGFYHIDTGPKRSW